MKSQIIFWLYDDEDVKWFYSNYSQFVTNNTFIQVVLTTYRAYSEFLKIDSFLNCAQIQASDFSLSANENSILYKQSAKIVYDFIFNKHSTISSSKLLYYNNVHLLELHYEILFHGLYRVSYALKVYEKLTQKFPNAKILTRPAKKNFFIFQPLDEYIKDIINMDESSLFNLPSLSRPQLFPVIKRKPAYSIQTSQYTASIYGIGTRYYSLQLKSLIENMKNNEWQIIYLSPYIREEVPIPIEFKELDVMPLNICWFVDDDINKVINEYFEYSIIFYYELLKKNQILDNNLNNYLKLFFIKQLAHVLSEHIYKSLYYLNCAKNFFSSNHINLLITHTSAYEFTNTARNNNIKIIHFQHGTSSCGFDIPTAFAGALLPYGHFKQKNMKKCGVACYDKIMIKSYLHYMDNCLLPSYVYNYKSKTIDFRRPVCLFCDNFHNDHGYLHMEYGNTIHFVDTLIQLTKKLPTLQIIWRLHFGEYPQHYTQLKDLEKYGVILQEVSANNCFSDNLPYADFVIMTGMGSSVIESLIRGRPVIYYTKKINYLSDSNGYPNKSVIFAHTEKELFKAVYALTDKQIDNNVVQFIASNFIDGFTPKETDVQIGNALKKYCTEISKDNIKWKEICFQHTEISNIDRIAGRYDYCTLIPNQHDALSEIILAKETSKRIISSKYFINVSSVLNYKYKDLFIPFTIELLNDSFYRVLFLNYDIRLEYQSNIDIFRENNFIYRAISHFVYICYFLKTKHYYMDASPSDLIIDQDIFKICTPEKLFSEKSLKSIYGLNTIDALVLLKMKFDINYVLPILINYYCNNENHNFYIYNRSMFLLNTNKPSTKEHTLILNDYANWTKLMFNLQTEIMDNKIIESGKNFMLNYIR